MWSMRPEPSHRTGDGSGRSLLLALAIVGILLPGKPGGAAEGQGLRFSRRGVQVSELSRSILAEDFTPRPVRVFEPYEKREVMFEAVPLADVLDAVYSPSWRDEKKIPFTCSDGYQPTVPAERLEDHRAWLAMGRADRDAFTIEKRESGEQKTIDVGPYYVVWENLSDEQIRQEGDYGWPYQVVAIDLIASRDRFPHMVPPAGASEAVLRGFGAFRVHCSKCHKVNGDGGTIGPELNPDPTSGEYYDPAFLRTWIVEPARIRPKTRMPALNPALPNRAAVVADLVAYLEAMAGVSRASQEVAP